MRCPNCQKDLSFYAKYCPNCGAEISQPQTGGNGNGNSNANGNGNGKKKSRLPLIIIISALLLAAGIFCGIHFSGSGGGRRAPTAPTPTLSPTPTPAPTSAPTATTTPAPSDNASAGAPVLTFDSEWNSIVSLQAGYSFIAGLRDDGTVVVLYVYDPPFHPEFDVSSWGHIKKISARGDVLVGLRDDGTVVATGDLGGEQEDMFSWTNIVDVSTGGSQTVGVRSDGTVVFAGLDMFIDETDYTSWRGVKRAEDIVCSAGCYILGFAEDGTLLNDGNRYADVTSSGWLTVGVFGDGSFRYWGYDAETLQPEMQLWSNIKQVCPGDTKAIGLRYDGRLEFAGICDDFRDAASWTDIDRIILVNDAYLIGIKADGSVKVAGSRAVDTGDWHDIVNVVLFDQNLVGLKSDGSIVTAALSS